MKNFHLFLFKNRILAETELHSSLCALYQELENSVLSASEEDRIPLLRLMASLFKKLNGLWATAIVVQCLLYHLDHEDLCVQAASAGLLGDMASQENTNI